MLLATFEIVRVLTFLGPRIIHIPYGLKLRALHSRFVNKSFKKLISSERRYLFQYPLLFCLSIKGAVVCFL